MADRQPRRSRKLIDYTKFGAGDDHDDDDDFADSTPPPFAKKQKVEIKKKKGVNLNVKVKTSSKNSDEKTHTLEHKKNSKVTNRLSVEDKVYQRQMELALEMSKTESSQENTSSNQESIAKGDVIIIDDDNLSKNEEIKNVTKQSSDEMKTIISADEKNITRDSETDEYSDSGMKGRTTRKRTVIKRVVDSDTDEYSESDDDFKPTNADGDGTPSDVDSDEDFKENAKDDDLHINKAKTGGKAKVEPKSKKGKAATSNSSVKPKAVQSTNVTTARSPVPLPKSCSNNSMSSPASSKPKWVAPGMSGAGKSPLGGVNVRSPTSGSGGLRLGLSKKIKVKPLHSSVKLPT